MNFKDWENGVPADFVSDPLWNVEAYRLALFLADVCWHDVTKLIKDQRTRSLSDQLYRAIGSISANIAEGYSYASVKNKIRYYEYALGSTRESRGWYYQGRHILTEEIVQHRIPFLSQISRLLITMNTQQRSKILRESTIVYNAIAQPQPDDFNRLLNNIPLP